MRLTLDPGGAVPIWRQIEEGVRRQVATGALGRGQPVPSVRDLARTLLVNPATVAKAYQRLTDAGVLTVHRGEGTFVADAAPRMHRSERLRLLRDGALKYADVAASVGATAEETLRELETVLGKAALPRAAGGER